MERRAVFPGWVTPFWLLLPQLLITFVFFLWPASQALYQSFLLEDAFGLSSSFVWLENYSELIDDPHYLASFQTTLIFCVATAGIALALGLLFAGMTDWIIRGGTGYQVLLVWPYAVAPALAGALWYFMFNPSLGIIAYLLQGLGYGWNHYLNGSDALILVIAASIWKQISYNFLFFLAGLQAIPRSIIEAAAIDGAGPVKRFITITLPLLSPTIFFLIVMNSVYAFFDTFGVIHATTAGGPYQATSTLVFKVYSTGFVGQDLGGSAAQSVILMAVVILLVAVQFRTLERRVHY